MKTCQSGVYEIVNTVNGKRYIGSAADIKDRCYEHRRTLRHGTHVNRKLQSSWNKHGETAFVFRPVLICARVKEQLLLYELLCMKAFKPEYNLAPLPGSNLGVKHTPEQRAANSERQRGKPQSPESVAKRVASNKGRKRTPEFCSLISKLKLGKKLSPAHCASISKVQTGKKQSEKAVAARAASNRGKKRTTEQKARIGDGNRGKVRGPLSLAHRLAISKAVKGVPLGPQPLSQRLNNSATHKGKPWSAARRAAQNKNRHADE